MGSSSGHVVGWLFLLVLCATSAWGQASSSSNSRRQTGNEWLAECGPVFKGELDKATLEVGECIGWVGGLLDMNALYGAVGVIPNRSEGFCMPESATLGQAGRVIVKYLEDRPSALHLAVRALAYEALKESFRCTRP